LTATASLLDRIRASSLDLRDSERKVADAVLAKPGSVIHASISDLARIAEVSEPTVIRFCRATGFDGFRDFKVHLAQDLASGTPYVHQEVSAGDRPGDVAMKVLHSTIDTLSRVATSLDKIAFERATDALAAARRVDFYGFGASGAVAQDAYHKFFRLKGACNALVDPHVQVMAAATLEEGDVVVAISHTGRTAELLESVEQALSSGATVIAITAEGSALARVASLLVAVNVPENTGLYTPMTSRIAHLAVIDALATAVALRGGARISSRLRRVKDSLSHKRLPEGEMDAREG
jgi:RpiR family carbohydrate utilization transcriptional regulator